VRLRVAEQAQREIKDCFNEMSARVYAVLRRLSQGDDPLAEDVLHETFIKAWKNWPVLRDLTEEKRAGWLIEVAVNTAMDVFRRNETAREKMPEVWTCYHPPESAWNSYGYGEPPTVF
jgi:DNA-directed RNA polymerase specialized sigma24 family protein